MSRLLLLCRHGNTFHPGEKVVMVGAREDLALTPVGKAQAAAVGQALVRLSIVPGQTFTGPLQRTREFAEIVSELVGQPNAVRIDPRLVELDYGAWGGLSDDEIRERWGPEPLDRWQREGRRPDCVVFSPSAQEVESQVRAQLAEFAGFDGVTLVVTSNGRLREFARALSGQPHKVRTGHVCVLVPQGQCDWKILHWDCDPSGLRIDQ